MTIPMPMVGSGPYGTSPRRNLAKKPTTTAVVKEITADSPRVSVDATNNSATAPGLTWKEKISRQYKKFYRRD